MLRRIAQFYIDGFRHLSWGKPLWILVLAKLVFLFLIMRLIFFRPTLSGLSDSQKSAHVASSLSRRHSAPVDTAVTNVNVHSVH